MKSSAVWIIHLSNPNFMYFNSFRELLKSDRSVRRFRQSQRVSYEALAELVELTRYCASGRNIQSLRYLIIRSEEDCARIFPLLKWAGYLPDWVGPAEGERPAAYLVQANDTRYGKNILCDDGLQLQAITLGAKAKGLSSCIIKAFNPAALAKEFALPDYLEPLYVVALGEGAEEVEIVDTDGSQDADIKYFRTADGIHHVPKRPLNQLIIE